MDRNQQLRAELLRREASKRLSAKTSDIQPALDIAGTAIGVGGQALEKAYETQVSPIGKAALKGVGMITKPIAKAYDWTKNQIIDNPVNFVPNLMSDDPSKGIEGNLPIKKFIGGKLETTANIPISESPKSIMKHLQSLGIDVGLGELGAAKYAKYNEPSEMLTRASKAQSGSERIMAEILQPKTGEMEDVLKYASKEVTPTKDYAELATKLGQSKESLMNQRNLILSSSKKKIGEEYLKPVNELYQTMIKDPQLSTKAEPLAMAINREYEYLFSKPGKKISLLEAEQRKENLQKMTESLLESGGADISDPALKQAWDKIRYGFRKSIAKAEPEVEALNKPYGGLNEATSLAEIQRDLALKEGQHSRFGKIGDLLSHILRPSKGGTAAALAREAFRRESSLLSKTKKAEKLYKKAESLRDLAGKKIRGEK